jgi:alpha-N-acetylglucosaminidase
LATRRLGKRDKNAIEAWQLLLEKIYVTGDIQHQISLTCARPCFTGHSSGFTDNTIAYDNKDLLKAWTLLLKSDMPNPTDHFKFDVVNIGRQVLGNYFTVARDGFTAAYKRKDLKSVEIHGKKMMEIINDMDELLATNENFLLGKWLRDAEVFGRTKEEKAYYNEDARKIVTVWGGSISDYASREWAGLMKDYYGERWGLFIADATDAVKNNIPFDDKAFGKKISEFGKEWPKRTKRYSTIANGDYLKVSKALLEKYASDIGRSTL